MPGRLAYNGDAWVIREYKEEDVLVVKDIYMQSSSRIKPYPLKSQLITEDYPVWDSGDIPMDIEDELVEMEDSGEITDYYDYTDCFAGHIFRHKNSQYFRPFKCIRNIGQPFKTYL